ncbi:PACRG-like protein isoform X2 [Hydra vulgaris]|uniref:PACRG-like protein isoform X2 n=1 Tax=Hydra vulgaris TaxID=6087 RepID=A0ABM4BKW2_HYDVU
MASNIVVASPKRIKSSTVKEQTPAKCDQSFKVSDRLNPKTVDPFNKKEINSIFMSAYARGAIPCRLVHGSVKHSLQWTKPPESLEFDPLLLTFAEGLKETLHPYSFLAYEGFMQLLMVKNANIQLVPLLPKLTSPFKNALLVDARFKPTLEIIVQVSNLTGTSFNQSLKNILPQISRKISIKSLKDTIVLSLQKIETNGGPECSSIIKLRIPTYTSVL